MKIRGNKREGGLGWRGVAGWLLVAGAMWGGTPAQGQTGAVSLVPMGALWRFHGTSYDLNPGWRAAEFDDTPWGTGRGELGFGDGDETTMLGNVGQITTYFRRTFVVADPGSYSGLDLTLVVDDGAVVYLNSTEALRVNLPAGPINDMTPALQGVENARFSAPINRAWLRPGTNVIAVEVHQAVAGWQDMDDLSFDCALVGTAPAGQLPIITLDPSSRTLYGGEVARFYAEAQGSLPLAIQWSLEGQAIPGATNRELIFVARSTNQAGGYSMVVSNPYGTTTSAVAMLTVQVTPPDFSTLGPISQGAALGEAVTLTAWAYGQPTPSLQWLFNAQPLLGATGQVLTLTQLTTNQAGDYALMAWNEGGYRTSEVATLSVAWPGPLDRWSWKYPVPQGNDLFTVASGNGICVALGDDGVRAISSDNGLSWRAQRNPGHELSAVAFGHGHFVALEHSWTIAGGTTTAVETSADGLHWTHHAVPAFEGSDFNAVAFGDGRFVAVSAQSESAISTNGVDWVVTTAAPLNFGGRVVFGGGLFVALLAGNAEAPAPQMASSPDGLNWTARGLSTSRWIQDLAWGNGEFLAAGQQAGDGSSAVFASTDLISWTNVHSLGSVQPTGLGFGGGRWVIVTSNPEGTILTSADGTHWTKSWLSPSNGLNAVTYTGDGFVAVGRRGNIFSSPDGGTWTARSSGTSMNLRSLAHGHGCYVATGNEGLLYTSSNGLDWVRRPGLGSNNWRGVAFGAGRFVAVGEDPMTGGAVMVSSNGMGWSVANSGGSNGLYDVAYGNGLFVAVGDRGAVMVSESGLDWSSCASATVQRLNSVAWGEGGFAAVGRRATVVTSPDGTHWTRRLGDFDEAPYLQGVAQGNGVCVAAGKGGAVFTATNFSQWTSQTAPFTGDVEDVIFANGLFIAIGETGLCATSPDGRLWTLRATGCQNDLRTIIYAEGYLTAVGNNESIIRSDFFGPPILRVHPPTDSDGFVFSVDAEVGRAYVVQASEDLRTWEEIFTFSNAQVSTLFEDTEAWAYPHRAYRVLAAPPAPIISVDTHSPIVSAGATVTLSITGLPGTGCTCQWRKNGANLPGATNASLTLVAAQPSDSGTYSVLITSAEGLVSSTSLALVVVAVTVDPGSLDPSFDPTADGTVLGFTQGALDVSAAAVQADGGIVVAGSFTGADGKPRPRIARLDATGRLDPLFRPATSSWLPNFAAAQLVTQPEGAILLACDTNLIRLRPDGSVDESFQAIAAPLCRGVNLQSNGLIIVWGGGYADGYVDRLNPDGARDPDFHRYESEGYLQALYPQQDGGILIAETVGPVTKIWRLNADGTPDDAFAAVVRGEVYALAAREDGQVYLGGYFDAVNGQERHGLARLNPDGSLDLAYSPQIPSAHERPWIQALALQPDGSLIIGGTSPLLFTGGMSYPGYGMLLKLGANGVEDAAFTAQVAGLVTAEFGLIRSLTAGSSGQLLAVGSGIPGGVIRVAPTGTSDPTFSPNLAGAPGGVTELSFSPQGAIYVAGPFTGVAGAARPGFARLHPNGALDLGFVPDLPPEIWVAAHAVQPDGRVIISTGRGRYLAGDLLRLNANGSLDRSYNPIIRYSNELAAVTRLLVQPDGRLLVGGAFDSVNGTVRHDLARINQDGTLDSSFDAGNGVGPLTGSPSIEALALQPDGRILVGGGFTEFNGATQRLLARLNPDGSVDTGFYAAYLAQPESSVMAVESLALQADGRIVVGLKVDVGRGEPVPAVVRLRSDGSLDESFHLGEGVMAGTDIGWVNALVIQPDGRIVVGGAFDTFAGVEQPNLVRIYSDGQLDRTFNVPWNYAQAGRRPYEIGPVAALVLQPDGRLLVGGSFQTIADLPRWGVARLNTGVWGR
jgi:uncharacterized delta-60 repeat protein